MAISQGTYKLSPPTLADGQQSDILLNATGGLIVTSGGTGATADQVQGTAASGASDTGNPVKVGGMASASIPTTVSAFQRVNLWLGLNGQTVVGGTTFAGADGTSNTLVQMTISGGGAGHQSVAGFLFNGTSWDRASKPSTTNRIASAAASTNATSAKAAAGNLHNVTAYNTTAAVKYLKIYNKASAPTVGTDTPIFTFAIPPNGTLSHSFPNGGYYASTGIAYALTGAAADSDTTALVAGDVVGVNVAYS